MSRDVSFSMNTGVGGGKDIIQEMAKPLVTKSANAIASRAGSISGMSFKVNTYVGNPNRYGGTRAVAEITADDTFDDHQRYKGFTAVQKSKDAGRV